MGSESGSQLKWALSHKGLGAEPGTVRDLLGFRQVTISRAVPSVPVEVSKHTVPRPREPD